VEYFPSHNQKAFCESRSGFARLPSSHWFSNYATNMSFLEVLIDSIVEYPNSHNVIISSPFAPLASLVDWGRGFDVSEQFFSHEG
jgi:hypothetical protein